MFQTLFQILGYCPTLYQLYAIVFYCVVIYSPEYDPQYRLLQGGSSTQYED